jgi:hypothetical protein
MQTNPEQKHNDRGNNWNKHQANMISHTICVFPMMRSGNHIENDIEWESDYEMCF